MKGVVVLRDTINRPAGWERSCLSVYQHVDLYLEGRRARQNCRRYLTRTGGGLGGSRKAFQQTVLPFWRPYGLRPRKMWYDCYGHHDGHYNPYYIPEDLYWQAVYPALNQVSFRRAYTDKCFYQRLFSHFKHPRTIVKNSNGLFYDARDQLISRQKAKQLLAAESRFVVKPAIYSGEGTDVLFHDRTLETPLDPETLFNTYGQGFVIQEVVQQHPVLADIHPPSLNTIRLISFLFQGSVHMTSAILRMGVGGSRLDNISSGGLACPIGPDGRLAKTAVNRRSQRKTQHPGGTVFEQVTVPAYEQVLSAVDQAHRTLPHFRLIGWDFAIDQAGDPVFIEYNGAPSLNQISCGPLFGDLTPDVLAFLFLRRPEQNVASKARPVLSHAEQDAQLIH